ncbi:putative signal peptide [Beijerinckiaceae bacterium RH AL1]|nr:hypothetical protein [Beijerinckiaceae bacterium]VVB49198.1 putative signal peptide [Beijerinckiaceae bacterium RH CH11]VVB49277.1 putative signal peptide [Beijerinckiaceae bacterium RH AL8]VVC56778.1 putative signal peptide [Beijerinckiaceae bacterium RH AL1]
MGRFRFVCKATFVRWRGSSGCDKGLLGALLLGGAFAVTADVQSAFAQTALGVDSSSQGQSTNDANSPSSQIENQPLPTTGRAPLFPPIPTFVIGDGTLTVGGLLRFRYDARFNEVNAYGNPRTTNHFSYDTAGPKIAYDSTTFFGSMQYRFYGGSFIYSGNSGYKDYPGEVSFPMWGYIGYKLTPHDSLTGGLNQAPFGLVPYYGSSFIESLAFTMGIEEVYAPGIKYSHDEERYDFQLAFYPTANPNGFGVSRDSARYSTAIVSADTATPNGSSNAERNIIVGRAEYYFVKNAKMSLVAGADVWHSTVANFNTGLDGFKQNEGAHLDATYGPWDLRVVVVRQDIYAKNPISNDFISIGGFDSSYNMATHGNVLTTELNYKLPGGIGPFNVMPYVDYDAYYKDNPAFRDTQRYILGAAWTYKRDPKLLIYTEGIFGKNDPYVGAGEFESGLAQGGDNKWRSEVIVNIGYYF